MRWDYDKTVSMSVEQKDLRATYYVFVRVSVVDNLQLSVDNGKHFINLLVKDAL